MMPPSAWFGALLPNGLESLDRDEAGEAIELIMDQYNEIMGAVANDEVIIPEPDEVDACSSFATGYTMAAALDEEWIGHDDRWSFAAPFAFLAGQEELIPEALLNEMHADPDVEQTLRNNIASVLKATQETFRALRKSLLERSGAIPRSSGPKVGRNDPCPCGSGKKYKRCCGAPGARALN
jgi:uncharacterized protein